MGSVRWMARGALLAWGLGAALAMPEPAHAFDVKRADASVVRVLAYVLKDVGGQPQRVAGLTGTGFVIAPGHVATNYHVINIEEEVAKVDGARGYIAIREPGAELNAEAVVIWKSKDLDLAVLKVPGLKRQPLVLSSAAAMTYPQKGARVYAIGYPAVSDAALQSEEGWLTSTLTSGIVGKTVRAPVGGTTRPVIQHDAAINTGNSGGPLFDNCNVVVGVNTFVALSHLRVMEDEKGERIATGPTSAGISVSPHIGNLIDAVKTVPALRGISLQLTASECSDEPPGIPIWLYGAVGVFAVMAMTGMIVAFTRRREVVRVVESYSAWVRRKGVQPGAPRTSGAKPPAAPPAASPSAAGSARPSGAMSTSEPTGGSAMPAPRGRMEAKDDPNTAPPRSGTGDWVLSGFDTQGNTLRVAISQADLDKGMCCPEKGVILGRSSSLSDKIVNDPSVSRRHAKIARGASGGLAIEDLNSAYGTRVNDAIVPPFESRPLAPGDRVTMGAVTLDFSQMP